MIEVTILVPLADNDGNTFTPAHHRNFEALLSNLFAGFTRDAGTATGGWVDGGVTYRDELAIYVVFVDGLLSRSVALHEALSFAKSHYRQLAVTVRYLGVAEII